MSAIALVVFDIVGTTIEDRGEVVAAFTTALHESGIGVTEEELRPWRGAPKREVLRFFIERQFGQDESDNPSRIQRAYTRFREQLESSYSENGVRVIPGAHETFDWLQKREIKIALTTGFYRRVTDIVLQSLGLDRGVISASVCSEQVLQGRPAPYMIFRAMEATGISDVRRVVKVGDTARDLLAGTNAGVRGVVGVLSGSQSIDQLGSVAHTHIIPSVAELPGLLDAAFR